ncbi:MAG: microcin C transport system ATP-binding protein [Oleiphilaceae bacterium]|jgi:microcin C transport system ATP-binding protein
MSKQKKASTQNTTEQTANKQMDKDIQIQIKNLSVCFSQGDKLIEAVKDVSLTLYKGETLAIVGESGSGKSVTAQAILGLHPKQKVSYPTGEIIFDDKDLLKISDAQMRAIRGAKIGMIFQEPMTSLNPLHTIEKQIGESILLHNKQLALAASDSKKSKKTPLAIKNKVIELLTLVGIPSPEERLNAYPHQLSGGQKQRVMIAMALANEPDVLIADEPTTALDVTVQKQVLELIKSLQKRLGMSVILISHDLTIVKHYADSVAVMYHGKVIESGLTSEIFDSPKEAYTEKLIHSDPKGRAYPIPENSPVILSSDKVNVWFPQKTSFWGKTTEYLKAANDISIQLKAGETLGIVGESGSGKTTLGLALLKLLPSTGTVIFEGKEIQDLNQAEFRPFRRDMQIVFQDPYGSLSPRMSIFQIIEEGLLIHNISDKVGREKIIIDALEEVGLDAQMRHRFPHEFSGGQRQRIAIARALVLKPKLIILDEPTSALDRTVQAQVVELLRNIQAKYGIAYIFISHDLAVVKALSHHVMVMKQGLVVEQNSCDQIFNSPKQSYTKNLLEAAYFYS